MITFPSAIFLTKITGNWFVRYVYVVYSASADSDIDIDIITDNNCDVVFVCKKLRSNHLLKRNFHHERDELMKVYKIN